MDFRPNPNRDYVTKPMNPVENVVDFVRYYGSILVGLLMAVGMVLLILVGAVLYIGVYDAVVTTIFSL